MNIKSLGFKQTPGIPAALTITDLLPAGCFDSTTLKATVKSFMLQAETNAIRWRDDGTAPTASVGHILTPGQTLYVDRSQFATFQAIETAASAIANVTAYDGEGTRFVPFAGGSTAGPVSATIAASENVIGKVVGVADTPAAAQLTRPTNTTAYASGDLVANDTASANVVPLSFTVARVAAGSCSVLRGRIRKSTTVVTNAAFRIHLFTALPSCTGGAGAGDNAVFATVVVGYAGYIGYLDVTEMIGFQNGAAGVGAPPAAAGHEITVKLAAGQVIYGLIEARGAYAPGNAETFDVSLEVAQN